MQHRDLDDAAPEKAKVITRIKSQKRCPRNQYSIYTASQSAQQTTSPLFENILILT